MIQFLPMLLKAAAMAGKGAAAVGKGAMAAGKAAKPMLQAGVHMAQGVPDQLPPLQDGVLQGGATKGPNFFKDLGKKLLGDGSGMLLQNALGHNPTSGLKSIGNAMANQPPQMIQPGMGGGMMAGGRPMAPTFDPLSPMLRQQRRMMY